MDLELYKTTYSSTPSSNGGSATTIVEDGVLNNLLPDVNPFVAEQGGTRYIKGILKANSKLKTGICVLLPAEETETIEIVQDNANHESDLDKTNLKFKSAFKVQNIDKTNKQITADRDISNVNADDYITFYRGNNRVIMLQVESVDTNNNVITFKDMGDRDLEVGDIGSNTIVLDMNAGDEVGIWIKQTIKPYTPSHENPPDSFLLAIFYNLL